MHIPSVAEVKSFIVESLNLEGVSPSSLADDQSLFGDGLGLDSVDILELMVAVEKRYGVRIRSDQVETSDFESIRSLQQLIERRITQEPGHAS